MYNESHKDELKNDEIQLQKLELSCTHYDISSQPSERLHLIYHI